MSSSTVEAVVCSINDIQEGQMKEVELEGTKVLLVRESACTFHALGSKCTHYGAPLVSGSFSNGRVRCPWHGACFDVKTGDIEDFPGLDSIQKFEVIIKEGKVIVKADKDALEKGRRIKVMSGAMSQSVKKTVLIVGGGPSGLVCAETLRQEGFNGEIIIATKEKHLPYDRPKLSKALNVTPEQITLRDNKFCDEHKIQFKFEYEATKVDLENKKVSFKNDQNILYDYLVLATGTTPRVLTMIKGYDLENVTTLRTVDDAQFIAKESDSKDVVILGTSFIGVELAAALAGKAKSVSVVDLVEAPFQLALGKEIGNALKKLLVEKGVKFHFQTTAIEFTGEEGKVKEVVLKDGSKLPADLCIMGVGVAPVTEFINGSGIKITDRGFIKVNKRMETNKSGVYAVGDISQFPLFMARNESVNIQHWQMAHQQGRIAAMSIVGKGIDIRSVPFFWTVISGKSLRYTGYGFGYDDVVINGNLDELKFVAYYTKGDQVIAVATLNSDPTAAHAANFFLTGRHLTKTEVKKNPTEWMENLTSIHL